MDHKHGVYDSDTHFTIIPNSRMVKNNPTHKTTVIQHDHNSERFTFELPRYIEGHDMSICDRVEVHYLNVDTKTKEEHKGVYISDDLHISEEDENIVVCSWLISGNATELVGTLSFVVRYCCVDGGVITYAWNSAVATVNVSTGINATDEVITEYADVLEKWKTELFNAGYINADAMAAELEQLKSRVRVENDMNSQNGVFEGMNFAGQGETSNIYAFVLHNYTDGGILRLDNVGSGAIIQAVNAHNSTNRSDKEPSYYGDGNVLDYYAQTDPAGDGSFEQYLISRIDKNGDLFWSGWEHSKAGNDARNKTVKFRTNKLDGGTWAFNFDAANTNKYLMLLTTGGMQIIQITTESDGDCIINAPVSLRITGKEHLYLTSEGNIIIQTSAEDTPETVRFRVNGTYYYPQFTNRFCTSTNRPTQNIRAGEIFMETDTNRTIRRNAANNGWVDMNGNGI